MSIKVEYEDDDGYEVNESAACGTYIVHATNSKFSKVDVSYGKTSLSKDEIRKWIDFIKGSPFVSRIKFDDYKMVVPHKHNSFETFIMALTVFRYIQERPEIVKRIYMMHSLGFPKAQSILIGTYYNYHEGTNDFRKMSLPLCHMVFPAFHPMPRMIEKVREYQKNMYNANSIYKNKGNYYNKKIISQSLQRHGNTLPIVIPFTWGNKMKTRKLFDTLFGR